MDLKPLHCRLQRLNTHPCTYVIGKSTKLSGACLAYRGGHTKDTKRLSLVQNIQVPSNGYYYMDMLKTSMLIN